MIVPPGRGRGHFVRRTPSAQVVLRRVVNHGPQKTATTLPVSANQKVHRPNTLPHVLDALEIAHALGVEDISVARLEVQAKTGSAKPPGAVLHVLAVGIDNFGDKAADSISITGSRTPVTWRAHFETAKRWRRASQVSMPTSK